MHITKIPSRVRKYLYAEIIFKESKIPISQREKNTNLKGQKVSKLLWLDLDSIYVRSKRLRPTFLPSKVSTQKHPMWIENWEKTASIHDIAKVYKKYPYFHGNPVLFHIEEHPVIKNLVPVLYEGRHRCIGAIMAWRKYILSRQIGAGYSSVLSQKLRENKNYYKKPLYELKDLMNIYKYKIEY